MIQALLLLAGGVFALYLGAEWLVRGAARAGSLLGVSSLIVGLTVVSLGTSAPELVVSLLSALQGRPDLAVGNVLGSNLANVGLILGAVALIHPVEVGRAAIWRDIPLMIGVTVLVYPLVWDLEVGRGDGALLLAVLVVYLYALARAPRKRREAREVREGVEAASSPGALPERGDAAGSGSGAAARQRGRGRRAVLLRSGALAAVGAVALVLGGRGIVAGAVILAEEAGLPELIVGLSVVAVGTSLPELATSLVAAFRGDPGIAVGNVVGSNLFNLTAVLGATAVVQPIGVNPVVPGRELVAALALSALVFPAALIGRRIGRGRGVLFLVLYGAAWMWFALPG